VGVVLYIYVFSLIGNVLQ